MVKQNKQSRKQVRGIPYNDYQLLRNRVLAGEMTWEEAEAKGARSICTAG